MARGFAAVKAAAEKINSYTEDYDPRLFLRLPDDGDSAVVRFLEEGDEVYSYWYHDFSNHDKKNGWRVKVPCLDQDDELVPCPGCREELPRKFQGLINLIWRDAPVFERDDEGKLVKKNKQPVITGNEDQVAIWQTGIKIFNKTLAKKDVTFKGLSSRDFEITRDGTGFNDTTYSVEPVMVDGETKATPMSKADKELAAEKYDLEEVARFVDAERFEEIIEEQTSSDDEDDPDVSEFLNTKPLAESDE